jgi:hypothetical protein
MKKVLLFTFLITSVVSFGQKDKKAQDREAIFAMEGCHKVTFDFAETFSPDTSYQFYDNYSTAGIEYVFAVENEPNKIVLQHLLVVNDTFIVKHWRQDWLYENRTLLTFDKDRTWKKEKISNKEAKGTWTQKVFQVDDSPRYEGYGTWVHVDGRHFWESTAFAPLPRREYTKRSDYNVTVRHSHVEITDYGWILDQDNEKVYRGETSDELLVEEKGHEKFLDGDYDCQPAINWWKKNHRFWEDVRAAWNDAFQKNDIVKLKRKVDKKLLYETFFMIGMKYEGDQYDAKKARKEIAATIESYLN